MGKGEGLVRLENQGAAGAFSWVRKAIINVWVGVPLIHSRPSTTSVNRSGSATQRKATGQS